MLWRFWRDAKLVSYTPLVTTLLLEGANVGQLQRMWTERTAEGQSILSWILVFIALLLWHNFYLVCTPDQRKAIIAARIGMVMNATVVLTVAYFRYFA
jgi:hypothetical protein